MASLTRSNPANSRPARREATDRRILDATVRLLAEGTGFTELSVERLISEAGISRSTFYNHFADKGALVKLLAAELTGELLEAVNTWWEVAERRRRDDIERALASVLEVYKRHEPVFLALMETSAYDESVAVEYRTRMNELIDIGAKMVRGAQRAGAMRKVPARETATALTWMVERSAYEMLNTGAGASSRRLAVVLTDVIWQTLYADVGDPKGNR
jgi:TetR/AcrR family transcriptional regulator, ethionamide resistance regulator